VEHKRSSTDRRLGDQFLERILSGGGDSTAAHDLLNECFRGYPVENLRRLLKNSDEAAVKAGVWIASELGNAALPLLGDVAPLLDHPSPHVRFFALDVVLLVASATHGDVIATAIHLIDHTSEAVRWKCMQFLARATPAQLRASLPHLTDLPVAARVIWLLEVIEAKDVRDVLAALDGEDTLARRFAAVAAMRLAPGSLAPLEHAAAIPDTEISSFAQEALKNPRGST
jgi:hypothetical protein